MKIYIQKYSFWGFLTFSILTVLFLVGAHTILHWIMTVLFLALSIISLTYKSGVEFSRNFMFRKFSCILGECSGNWEKIPDVQYISVIRVKQAKYRMTGGFTDQENTNDLVYRVNLIFENNKHKTIVSTNKENALKYAIDIAKYFNLNVLDFTKAGHKKVIAVKK